MIAVSAVFYHNTESGSEMEKKIGEELKFENLADRVNVLFEKTKDFILLKGMDAYQRRVDNNKEMKTDPEKRSSSQQEPLTKESIREEERKKIGEIIEREG
jgi:hypothetical protein